MARNPLYEKLPPAEKGQGLKLHGGEGGEAATIEGKGLPGGQALTEDQPSPWPVLPVPGPLVLGTSIFSGAKWDLTRGQEALCKALGTGKS